jgi:hypothetical protein
MLMRPVKPQNGQDLACEPETTAGRSGGGIVKIGQLFI